MTDFVTGVIARPEIRYTKQVSMRGFTFGTIGFATVETEPKSKAPLLSRICNQSQEVYLSVDWFSRTLESPIVIKQFASELNLLN